MSKITERIVEVAKSKVASTDWKYDTEKDEFGKDTNKCNKFVYDVLVEAGVRPPPTVAKYVVFTRPPTAGEWADPKVSIKGWLQVADAQPGDVAAEAHAYRDATGHVAIVVGPKETVSASAPLGGVIVQNDWGFRDGQEPTFRRYSE